LLDNLGFFSRIQKNLQSPHRTLSKWTEHRTLPKRTKQLQSHFEGNPMNVSKVLKKKTKKDEKIERW